MSSPALLLAPSAYSQKVMGALPSGPAVDQQPRVDRRITRLVRDHRCPVGDLARRLVGRAGEPEVSARRRSGRGAERDRERRIARRTVPRSTNTLTTAYSGAGAFCHRGVPAGPAGPVAPHWTSQGQLCTCRASRTDRTCRSCGSCWASVTLGPCRAYRTCGSCGSCWANVTLRACRACRTGVTLGPCGAYRTCRSCAPAGPTSPLAPAAPAAPAGPLLAARTSDVP